MSRPKEEAKIRFPVFMMNFRSLADGISQSEFADKLGISRQTVGFYWNGGRVPDAIGLRNIADKCGVSADWLLGLSDKRQREASVSDYTGLTEYAIEVIRKMDADTLAGLNTFLEGIGKKEA